MLMLNAVFDWTSPCILMSLASRMVMSSNKASKLNSATTLFSMSPKIISLALSPMKISLKPSFSASKSFIEKSRELSASPLE